VILATYVCALVWITGWFYPAVFKPAVNGVVSAPGSWTTIMFGLPALVAGWSLARVDHSVLERMSLSTFVASLICVVNASVTVAYAALRQSISLQETWTFLGITLHHPWWLIIMASTAANLLTILVMYCARFSRYIDRLDSR
jgi:hypothetical protein